MGSDRRPWCAAVLFRSTQEHTMADPYDGAGKTYDTFRNTAAVPIPERHTFFKLVGEPGRHSRPGLFTGLNPARGQNPQDGFRSPSVPPPLPPRLPPPLQALCQALPQSLLAPLLGWPHCMRPSGMKSQPTVRRDDTRREHGLTRR
jgi:hypothetical protein